MFPEIARPIPLTPWGPVSLPGSERARDALVTPRGPSLLRRGGGPGDAFSADCYRAREGIAIGDSVRAAAALKRLAVLASSNWSHASEQVRDRLARPITSLAVAACRIARGEHVSIESFDDSIGALHVALALHHREVAFQGASRHDAARTAAAICTSTHHARCAAVWSDRRFSDGVAKAVADAQRLADELALGAAPQPADALLCLTNLDDAIHEIDRSREAVPAGT